MKKSFYTTAQDLQSLLSFLSKVKQPNLIIQYIINQPAAFNRLVLDLLLLVDLIFKKGVVEHDLHLDCLQTDTVHAVQVFHDLLLDGG